MQLNPTNETQLSKIIEDLPQQYRTILGHVTLPQDNGNSVATALHNGDTVIGASDGSIRTHQNNTEGTYAYILTTYDSDRGQIYGYQRVPKTDEICSQTAEMYGYIGQLFILYIVTLLHRIKDSESTIILTTDNKETFKRASKIITPTNIKQTLATEYDQWRLLQELIQLIPLQITHKWVKGHQDEDKKKNKIIGPLTREVYLNSRADTLATTAYDIQEIPHRYLNHHSVFGLYTDDRKYVTNIRHHINNIINAPPIIQYLQQK